MGDKLFLLDDTSSQGPSEKPTSDIKGSPQEAQVNRVINDQENKVSCTKRQSGKCKGTFGPNFVPGPNDVICARGKTVWNHVGNKRFRAIVDKYCDQYKNVSSKYERSIIVTEIVNAVRAQGNGFVRFDEANGEWVEAGNMAAREKVGQYFRSILGYKSSFQLKKDRLKVLSKRNSDKVWQVVTASQDVRQAMDNMHNQHRQVKPLTDKEALAMFSRNNIAMLQLIKSDDSLLARFQEAEGETEGDQEHHNDDGKS